MAPERWERVKNLLEAFLALEPGERAAFLDRECAGDEEVRREVESLAAAYEAAGDLLEEPALGAGEDYEDREGRRIGPYRIVREIGEGGMSRVYLGVRADDAFRKQVAIKLVKRGMDYEFILRRFRNERQIMASLDHPNIARLFDGGTTEDGVPYFVMEYIHGRPIDRHCDEYKLPVRQRLELFRTVCSAVQYAHDHLIIHRDIKPGNILITADGVPKLLDFGIAKILNPDLWTGTMDPTASVLRLMTPEYASPEQIRGEPVTTATDVYSLGVLLYELLCGHRPYRLKSRAPHEVAKAICEIDPDKPSTAASRAETITRAGGREVISPEDVGAARATRPDRLKRALSGDLDNIVMMAMRKQPERRYPSAAALSADLGRYLEGRTVTARKDTVAYRAAKLLQRHRTAAVSFAIATPLLAGALALGFAWFRPGASTPAQPVRIAPLTTLQGNETQPSFSFDGTRVAFVWSGERGENSDVYTRALDGGPLVRVTTDRADDFSPAWSPDGARVAWLRTAPGETAVFVGLSAGGGIHGKITEVHPNRIEAVGRHLDWSPDGRYLAVADKTSPEEPFAIYLVEAATSRKIRLTAPPQKIIGDTGAAFSPDGKSVSFLRSPSSGISELYTVPLSGGEARRLTRDARVILSQAWAADGKSLVFCSNRTGPFTLWRIAYDGGSLQPVPNVGENATEPAFSRDGRYMAYSQFFIDANVWRADLEGVRPPQPVISSTLYDSSPQFSPDGKRVAFRSNRGGTQEIWVCDPDGRNAAQLTHFNGPLTGTPRWSPDGKWVAFDSRPEGQPDIYTIPAEGGPVRRITTEISEDVVPSWSHDGRWIYFASNRGGAWQVWKAPVNGGPKVQVTQNGGFCAFESADGRYLFYNRGRAVAGLYRMDLATGEEKAAVERLKPGYWGYWGVSRRGIYFIDHPEPQGPGALFFLRFGNHNPERLAAIEKPLALGDSALALSPDERVVLYTQVDQSGSDINLMQLR